MNFDKSSLLKNLLLWKRKKEKKNGYPNRNITNCVIEEIIKSNRKTADIVLPDLPTNKILLFMQI